MDVETHAIELADGRTLGFASYGDRDGAPLLWFHGTPGARVTGRLYDQACKDRGIHLLALDRPNYGISDPHRHTFTTWHEDVEQLADAIGADKFGVAGASGGGGWVLGAAHALPDRVVVAGLIACMGPTSTPSQTEGLSRGNRRRFQLARKAPPLLFALDGAGAWARRQPGPIGKWAKGEIGKTMPPVDREALADPQIGRIALAVYSEGLKNGGQGASWDFVLYARDWGFRLEDVTVPVHIWHGALDVNVPPSIAREMDRRLPNSTLVEYADQGHLITATRQADIFGQLADSLHQRA